LDYLISPIPDNEAERIAALQSAMCAYVPREDRFDRITRMAQRLLHVPIVLIWIIEDDVQWFRSAQGLEVPETSRDISFCGHAIMTADVFQVRDTHLDPRFSSNPLVVGPPYIRSYCGWPLEIALGLRVGTLCVLDTMPRTFAKEDLESLADMAHMVESELRVIAMSDNQKALLTQSSRDQRKKLLDPLTGNWSEAGFIELLRRTSKDVATGKVYAALCGIHIQNPEDFVVGHESGNRAVQGMLISQFIRQRMPPNAILCRLPGSTGCILFAAHSQDVLREQISGFLQEKGSAPVAGMIFTQQLEITSAVMRVGSAEAKQDPEHLLEQVMGRLAEGKAVSSFIR
jgi:GGDEF domain-containing protein